MSDTYRVWCPDYGHEGPEDGMAVSSRDAYNAQNAAEIWAARSDRDSGDYTIVGGSEVTVRVQDPDGTVTQWIVYGEAVPSYSATEAR